MQAIKLPIIEMEIFPCTSQLDTERDEVGRNHGVDSLLPAAAHPRGRAEHPGRVQPQLKPRCHGVKAAILVDGKQQRTVKTSDVFRDKLRGNVK